jgi:hypothetical protein
VSGSPCAAHTVGPCMGGSPPCGGAELHGMPHRHRHPTRLPLPPTHTQEGSLELLGGGIGAGGRVQRGIGRHPIHVSTLRTWRLATAGRVARATARVVRTAKAMMFRSKMLRRCLSADITLPHPWHAGSGPLCGCSSVVVTTSFLSVQSPPARPRARGAGRRGSRSGEQMSPRAKSLSAAEGCDESTLKGVQAPKRRAAHT